MKKLAVVGGLWLLGFGALAAPSFWPVDPYARFASDYNDVMKSQAAGVVDLVKIRKMQKAWRVLNTAAGWPDDEKPCVFETTPAAPARQLRWEDLGVAH